MITAIAALMVAFSYPGGSVQEFTSALANDSGVPVAVMAHPDELKVRAGDIAVSDLVDRRRLVGVKFGFDAEGKSKILGFGTKGWPRTFFRKLQLDLYRDALPTVEGAIKGKDGKISAEPVKERFFSLESLSGSLSKPLTWEPFFNDVRYVLAAKNVDEKEVLETVALAIGATLQDSEKGYEMRMDAKALRRRAAYMGRSPSNDTSRILKLRDESDGAFLATLVENLNDAELLGFYRNTKEYIVKFAPPTSPIHVASMRRLDAQITLFTPAPDNRVAGEDLLKYLKNVRRDAVVHAILRPDGNVACSWLISEGLRFVR